MKRARKQRAEVDGEAEQEEQAAVAAFRGLDVPSCAHVHSPKHSLGAAQRRRESDSR